MRISKRRTRERDESFHGTFTDAWVRATPPMKREVQYAERLKKGLSLMLYVSPLGTKTFRATFYDEGAPRSKRLGTYPGLSVAKAREEAFKFDPDRAIASAKAGTFKKIADEWMLDHVVLKGLRSKNEIERHLKVYVLPRWGKRLMFDIDRDDVSKLLRGIEKRHGAPMADGVLATIRGVMNWFAANGPSAYHSPIVRGMKRDKREATEKARARVLDDDEIRAIWTAASESGVFGAIVRVLLVTGQRRAKVATMRWGDVKDGVWTIRTEKREKGNAEQIRLPQLAVAILDAQQKIRNCPYVFPADRGKKAFNHFSQAMDKLREKLPEGMPEWRLHDLRRTARTRMSEIKVDRITAELTLGHKIKGIEGVYNRHKHFEEMSAALDKLATHIGLVLNPPSDDNLVAMERKRRA